MSQEPSPGQSPDPHPPAKRRPATTGSWRPGQSGNRRGRPAKGNALTESIREGVDPDELREIAMRLAREGSTEGIQIQALNWLRDSGFTRPADKHEIGAPGSSEPDEGDEDLEALSVEEHRRLCELDAERDRLVALARQRKDSALGDSSRGSQMMSDEPATDGPPTPARRLLTRGAPR